MMCPLHPSKTFSFAYWTLEKVQEIESHINTATTCRHSLLKNLKVKGLEKYQKSTPLLMTCSDGNLEAVKQIVKGWGVNVSKAAAHTIEGQIVDGVTPLFVAALHCHIEIVRYLVGKGAQVSTRTTLATTPEYVGLYCGATPLHAAVRCHRYFNPEGRALTIRFLLECGADPSALTQGKVPIWSPLDWSGNKIITLLVQWGLDVNQRCPDSGITLLHLWAGNRRYEDGAWGVVKCFWRKVRTPKLVTTTDYL